MDEKRPPGFTIYKDDFWNYAIKLGEEDLGTLLMALYQYSIGGVCDYDVESFKDPEGYAAYCIMKTKIAIDAEKYKKKCEINSLNRKGK